MAKKAAIPPLGGGGAGQMNIPGKGSRKNKFVFCGAGVFAAGEA
ncbi:MAG: hypothetical protein M0Z50_07940 [Planctomycetia bacterium]|nr:hypothetical protein [Planctomycetia bacterium]